MSHNYIFPCACGHVATHPIVRDEASYCPQCGERVYSDVEEVPPPLAVTHIGQPSPERIAEAVLAALSRREAA